MIAAGWTAEDEEKLLRLESLCPIAAMHIRIGLAQARERHRQNKLFLEESRERSRQAEKEVHALLTDPPFLRSVGIAPYESGGFW